MKLYIGVDFHPYQQTICWVDQETGEIRIIEIRHRDRERLWEFYRSQPPSDVGIEASGRCAWFARLLAGCGHTLRLGDAKKIRKRAETRHKNDRLDAELIWRLLERGDFPEVLQRPPESQDVLRMLSCRASLVRERTRVCNRLQAMARDAGFERCAAQTVRFREQLEAVGCPEAERFEREHLFGRLDELRPRIAAVGRWLAQRAAGDERVSLLQTQAGVGVLAALAFAHYVGDVRRFEKVRQVTRFLGYDSVQDASADRCRFGPISKQGPPLVRHLLGQAAHIAVRSDERLRSCYLHLRKHKSFGVAKTAAARRLSVKLAIMLRDGISAREFDERGR